MMVRAGIVGVTGYTGVEILSVLLGHPHCTVNWVSAKRLEQPEPIWKLFPRLKGRSDLICRNQIDIDVIQKTCDVVFLSLPHRVSMSFAGLFLDAGLRVIDLSGDYRFTDAAVYETWYKTEHTDKARLSKAVYGLTEWTRDDVASAALIANPGCYPTSALLGLLPVLKEGLVSVDAQVVIDAKSGVTGAGRNPAPDLHFAECHETMKAYKVLEHQHAPEIDQMASRVAERAVTCAFVPHLIPMNRGILSTIYVPMSKRISAEDLRAVFQKSYEQASFVRVMEPGCFPEIRHVTMTNYCDIGMTVQGQLAVIVSAIDNLMKGAAGQAVQNMNVMFSLKETEGF